jgi:hypothetical protein
MRRTTFCRPVGLSSVSLSVKVPLYSIPLSAMVTVKKEGVGENTHPENTPNASYIAHPMFGSEGIGL